MVPIRARTCHKEAGTAHKISVPGVQKGSRVSNLIQGGTLAAHQIRTSRFRPFPPSTSVAASEAVATRNINGVVTKGASFVEVGPRCVREIRAVV